MFVGTSETGDSGDKLEKLRRGGEVVLVSCGCSSGVRDVAVPDDTALPEAALAVVVRLEVLVVRVLVVVFVARVLLL